MINIEFNDAKVSAKEAQLLSEGIQEIVSSVTGIKDVFVYTNTAQIKVQIAQVEIFVRMTSAKIKDLDELTDKIKSQLTTWKGNEGFKHPINLTVIPMDWRVEISI